MLGFLFVSSLRISGLKPLEPKTDSDLGAVSFFLSNPSAGPNVYVLEQGFELKPLMDKVDAAFGAQTANVNGKSAMFKPILQHALLLQWNQGGRGITIIIRPTANGIPATRREILSLAASFRTYDAVRPPLQR